MEDNILNMSDEKNVLSLSGLNNRVKQAIHNAFPGSCWIQAETSDVRANASSGHCYLEFVEKDPRSGQLISKARGTIWAKTFHMLKPYFEQETGQTFTSGIKVLVKVVVDYHELYGFNLTVVDIDPTYTLGDMARRRMEIIRQLQEEGVFTLNKELPFPALPQRIAIITSPTAAGYEDFINQLTNNDAGYPFYTKLFPALMQGEKTETSIIAALDNLYDCREHFDVVVIIRGGGSTSDLSCFDSYLLAANCAQFPLPVITGIGHERDDTVVDLVAHSRMKTPTAVAEFLINRMDIVATELNDLQVRLRIRANDILLEQKNFLQLLGTRLPSLVSSRIEQNRSALQRITGRLPVVASSLVSRYNVSLESLQSRLLNSVSIMITDKKRHMELTEQFIKMASPDYILKRGYSMTLVDGHIVKGVAQLKSGDQIITRFIDGEAESIIK